MFKEMVRNYVQMVCRNSDRYFENKSETVAAFYLMID